MTAAVDILNESGRWLVRQLTPLSIELAVLTVVVIVALVVLRPKSPAIRHLFWCLVLLKPLTTLLVASPVSLYAMLTPQSPAPITQAIAGDLTGNAPPGPFEIQPETIRRSPAGQRSLFVRPERRPEPPLNRYGLAALVYLSAAVGLTLRLLLGQAYVTFLRQTSAVQRDGPLADVLVRTADRLGIIRHPLIAVSKVTSGPVLVGIIRPAILLPESLTHTLSPRQLEYVLAHELFHLQRRDNLVLLLQRLAEVVLFFHPAVWLCSRSLRREAETACDEHVLLCLGGAAAYADSLTRVAESRDRLTRRLLASTFAAPESNLAARVRHILRRPMGRANLGGCLPAIAALAVIAGLGLPTTAARTPRPTPGAETQPRTRLGDTAMSAQFEYGFRHDPLEFVRNDQSVDGALVRTFVFGDPQPHDRQLIDDAIAAIKIFEPPNANDDPAGKPFNINWEHLLWAAQFGATEDHPEVRRVLDLLDRIPERPQQAIFGDALQAFCLLGRADHPAIRHSLLTHAEHPEALLDPLDGCPWTPSGSLPALWAARESANVGPLVVQSLTVIRDQLEGTGCLAFNDPWSFVNCAAHIDHPVARDLLVRQVPMILRAQQPDGGWGENTFKVFAALRKHGLLDELRAKPPLPSDWRVVRSIPAPEGQLWGLLWDGRQLWTGERTSNEAVAVSTEDGRVLTRLRLPDGYGRWLGRWNGGLAVTQGRPAANNGKRLLQIDPEDGRILREVPLDKLKHVGGVVQVGDRIRVFDAYFGWVFTVDADRPSTPCQLDLRDPSPLPITANAGEEGTLWYVDAWAPWIVKCDHEGRLLDWSERPFGSYHGVAWDGQHLWAIDPANRRICAIEKSDTAPRPSPAQS